MEITALMDLLLAMVQARKSFDTPEKQMQHDKALVVAFMEILMEQQMALLAGQVEDAMLAGIAKNPNAPKA